MRPKSKRAPAVRGSTGNVFEDIGLPRPAEALAKAELAARIADTIEARGWTQGRAAGVLGVDQAKVSALMRGSLSGFSTDRLIRFLTLLGHDVEIAVRATPARRRVGRFAVRAV